MTSPSLPVTPAHQAPIAAPPSTLKRVGVPVFLLILTLLSTTAVGMRYMYNFNGGRAPLTDDSDILPFAWVFAHLGQLASGLPFSLTLIAILLAHEFGHYFACRATGVRCTLPLMLPAPSISGTFGAVIRLQSRIPSRSSLILIAASGPLIGFLVALAAIALGLARSTHVSVPVLHHIQAPLVFTLAHRLLQPADPLALLLPHPILSAAWIGILITSLNLIPAGQLDGGHIAYAISPAVHRLTSRLSFVALFLAGIFFWAPWMLWAGFLLLPSMKHPKVSPVLPLKLWHKLLAPACVLVLLFSATYEPFRGFDLLTILHKLPHRYVHP